MPTGGKRTSLVHAALQVASGGRTNVSFGPGEPVTPAVNEPPRAWDYPVSTNTNYTPRAHASFGFAELRAFANVELPRLAIETRKDQLEGLDWRIKPREGRGAKAVDKARIKQVEKLLAKPDGLTPFASWLRPLLEDLLVIDAPTIEKRRNRGGELIGLEVIDGSTIKVLIDDTGRRPRAPEASYQQVIKGVPWANLTTDDLIYAPRNIRPGHVYGFSPVEQIVVTINKALRRDIGQLAHFGAGMPPAMINAPEGWTPDQIRQYAEWVDSRLANNPLEAAKILWGPHGANYKPFKEPLIKDEFDEWIARVVCFCFSLPATAFIKQLNRSTSEMADATALTEGLEPLKRWWKRAIDPVIQDDLGFGDLEFEWLAVEDVDPIRKAEADERYVKSGILTIDRVRDSLGEAPLPKGAGSRAFVLAGSTLIPVDQIGEQTAEPDVEPDEPAEADGGE